MSVPATAEHALSLGARERIRASWASEVRRYSPLLHLAAPALFGVAIIGIAASTIRNLQWWEALFGVALLVLSNATEWRIHKSLLHRRSRLSAPLYDRHTPRHQMVFVTDDMAIRGPQEFRMVLLPPYAILGLVVFLSPLTATLWFTGHHNLAAVFLTETTGYVLVYEWLHLAFHFPRASKIGSLAAISWLALHHSIHHDPRIMQNMTNSDVGLRAGNALLDKIAEVYGWSYVAPPPP